MNLMFNGSSLKLSVMQYATCTNKPFFTSTEMGDTLKGMVYGFKFHVNKQAIIYLCNPTFLLNSFKFPEVSRSQLIKDFSYAARGPRNQTGSFFMKS